MPAEQSLETLRNIAQKVDLLIATITNGSGPGAPAAAPAQPAASPLARALDAGLAAHLRRLAATLSTRDLLEAVVDTLMAVSGAERGILMLLEEGSKLRFKSGRNVDQQALAGQEFAGSRELIRRVLTEGVPLHLLGSDLNAIGLAQLSGAVCLPLRFGHRLDGQERVRGALYLDSRASGGIPAERMDPLVILAEQAGVALENAFLVEDLSQHGGAAEIERLKANVRRLYDVGRSIGSTLILRDLLVLIVDHVIEISRAERGFIMLLEGPPGAQALSYRAGRSSQRETIAEEQFHYSTTIAQRCIQERRSVVLVEPLAHDISLSIARMELQAIMCVPLLEKDQVIGVVYVDSRQSNHEFDAADLEVVESLAGQAAVAIINAKLYQEAGERERLSHELDLAAKLQRDMLPRTIPRVHGLELHGMLSPALEVGGDYYDFIPHEGTEDSLTITIGDVSGKGVAAGLVMAMVRSALRTLIQHHGASESPLSILRSLNVLICRDVPPDMFMSLMILSWDAARRRIVYSSAGHEHLLVYRAAARTVEAIRGGGVACGVLESASELLSEHAIELEPGDQILLYTDGVTEAMDIVRQPFGLPRLTDLVREHGHLDPATLCRRIHAAVLQHRGAADPHDDITLVAFRARS